MIRLTPWGEFANQYRWCIGKPGRILEGPGREEGVARLAAMAMTWLLSTTLLSSLVDRPGVGSFSFAVLLNMMLPMWIVGVFAIADPNLDHPWLAPYFTTSVGNRTGAGTCIWACCDSKPF